MYRQRLFKKLGFKIWFWITLVTLSFLLITNAYAYFISCYSLKQNAYVSLADTLFQTQIYVDSRLSEISNDFDQIVNSDNYGRLLQNNYKNPINNSTNDIKNVLNDISDMCDKQEWVDSVYYTNQTGIELFKIKNGIVRHIGVDGIMDNMDSHWKTEWLNIHQETLLETVQSRNVLSIYQTISRGSNKCLLMVNISAQPVIQILQNVNLYSSGYFALIGEGKILYSISPQDEFLLDEDILKEEVEKEHTEWFYLDSKSGEPLMMHTANLQSNGWKLVLIVPSKSILSMTDKIGIMMGFFLLGALIVCIFVAFFISIGISKPINRLSSKVKQIDKDNLDVVFEVNSTNETNDLAEGLNKLLDRIRILIFQVQEKEHQKRKSDFAVMQEQINPHFLYNTLYSVKGLIDINEEEKAGYMIEQLISFFRNGLSKGKEIILVSEEIAYLKSYLEIQKIRYGQWLDYEISYDKSIESARMLRLLLQPLVENALYHGIKEKKESGIIIINFTRVGNSLEITIFDDGCGIPNFKLKKIKEIISSIKENDDSEGIYGIRNVQRRIELYYGEGYGLEYESVEDEYTQVKVQLPYFEDYQQGSEEI